MVIDCRMCYVYTYPKLDRQLQTILATHGKVQPGFLTPSNELNSPGVT